MPRRYRKLRGDTAYYPLQPARGCAPQAAMCGCCAVRAWRRWPWRRCCWCGRRFSAAGSRTPPRRCHRPGSHGPARSHPCDRAATGRDAGRPGRHPARRRRRPHHAGPQQSLPQPQAKFCPVPGTLRKTRPHRLAAHRRHRHRPARRRRPATTNTTCAAALTAFTPWAARCFWMRCSVSADAPTANWLIYGHNMHDGSMFGQLVRYRDEDFTKPTRPSRLTHCTRAAPGRSWPHWIQPLAQTNNPTTHF